MKEETVVIEKIIFGGDGLSRLSNGKVVFVPFVCPDEKVKIALLEEFPDYALGFPLEILEASPWRREAPCPYYTLCGGCQFQHLDYQAELEIKKAILEELFKRQGYKEPLPWGEIIPSPKIYGYRHKLRLHVESHPFKMGFVKRKTHEVLRIEQCLLGDSLLNEVLRELYGHEGWREIAFHAKRLRLEKSLLDERVTLLFWSILHPREELLQDLLSINSVKSIFYYIRGARAFGPYPANAPFGGRKLMPALLGLTYYIQPGVFTQTNWEINTLIMERLVNYAQRAERVLDLHSGMGNFLLPLVKALKSAKEFLGVDTDMSSIEDAFYTAEKNGLNGRLDFRRMSALEALHQSVKEDKKYDLILLDPPRGGCKELVRLITEVAEDRIIYISCDPPTLVRDILLFEKAGFALREVSIFDMFPRTYHFEVLALLQKKA